MSKELLQFNKNDLLKQLKKELGKTESDLIKDAKIVEDWANDQPHWPEVPSVNLIRSFLLLNKFSIELTKQKLDTYYTARSVLPEFFTKHPCSAEMKEQAYITPVFALPKLSKDQRRIIYSSISDKFGPEVFYYDRFMANTYNHYEILLREGIYLGSHYIFDCSGAKLGHLPRMNFALVKKSSTVMEKVFSNRVASIHLINYSSIFDNTLILIKPLLPEKIRNRIHIHKNVDELLKFFPRELLPKDLGGDEPSVQELTELWQEKLESHKTLFDKLTTMQVDESKRPAKLKNDDLLGFHGNFKKLDVD